MKTIEESPFEWFFCGDGDDYRGCPIARFSHSPAGHSFLTPFEVDLYPFEVTALVAEWNRFLESHKDVPDV